MRTRETVYRGTWYFAVEQYPGPWRITAPTDTVDGAAIECDFNGLYLPPIDWDEAEPDRTAVRVVIFDDPDFFHSLGDTHREFVMQIFANMVMCLLRERRPRQQFGFLIRQCAGDERWRWMHVEYYATLIRTDFGGRGRPPRLIARIWSGMPPAKFRKIR